MNNKLLGSVDSSNSFVYMEDFTASHGSSPSSVEERATLASSESMDSKSPSPHESFENCELLSTSTVAKGPPSLSTGDIPSQTRTKPFINPAVTSKDT